MHSSCFSLSLLSSLFAALFLAPALLIAADDAMAPPNVTTSGLLASPEGVDQGSEPAASLHDELSRPGSDTAVDIRSYERKDGTMITEYGPEGRVLQIKVQPPGGMPAYYLYRNAEGEFERRLPGGAKRIVPPSWILKEF